MIRYLTAFTLASAVAAESEEFASFSIDDAKNLVVNAPGGTSVFDAKTTAATC
jgi:hypothetical protein